jgi:hypothetical protein
VSSVFINGKTFRFLRDRLQHVRRRGIVAKGLTHVDEEVFIARRKHKAAAELERIFSQAVLFVSGRLGAAAGLQIISTQEVEQRSVAQPDSFVGVAFVIDQKRELDTGFFAKEFGVARVAQSNGGQVGAFPLELFFEFAQLRDMLSAEDSTIVAKEDEHRWSALPQGTEARWIAVGVR